MKIDARKAINDTLEYLDTGKEAEWFGKTKKDHGKVVEVRFEAFHDITVYEDGYEESFYIGD